LLNLAITKDRSNQFGKNKRFTKKKIGSKEENVITREI
jgi:hypothetical protein